MLLPPHIPQSSISKLEPHTLSQPDGAGSKQPQPKSLRLPPSHTPQSSNSKTEPQVLSQPDGAGSKQPQPKSLSLPPSHTPQLSVLFVVHAHSPSSSLLFTQLSG